MSPSTAQMRCINQGQSRVVRPKALPNKRATSGALVGASVAALMTLAPAYAGVQLEQPKIKNALVTTDDPVVATESKPLPDPAAKAKKKAPSPEATPVEPAAMEEAGSVEDLSVQALWPLGIVAAAGGLFALYKVDPGSEQFFVNAVKNSSTEGIGYEDKLKLSGGYAAPYYEMSQAERMAMGTKAIKKAKK